MLSAISTNLGFVPQKVAAPAPRAPQERPPNGLAQNNDTTVVFAGASLGVTQQRATGVEAYQAVEATAKVPNPFADTILSFIDAQLRRDVAEGANAEALQSRLQAGLDGFLEGYNQAFEQLNGSGMLSDEVTAQITDTKSRVMAGIAQLADELGVELDLEAAPQNETPATPNVPAAPVAANPALVENPGKAILSSLLRDVRIIEQYQKTAQKAVTYEHLGRAKQAGSANGYGYGVQQSRDFSLKLRTADGDAVTIQMSARQTGVAQFQANGDALQMTRYGEQESGFRFAVTGELDDDEMQALNDLLNQVADISQQFFGGDLNRAFAMAGEMRFDRNEIASFDLALHMSHTEVSQVAQPAAAPGMSNAFTDSVEKAGQLAEQLGQPRSLVADLLDWMLAQARAQDTRFALVPKIPA